MNEPPTHGTHPAWLDEVVRDAETRMPKRDTAPPVASRRAAVLVLIGPHESGGETVVLTERSAQLRTHPSQVAFPGGRIDPGDAGARGAALRETHEEVGVAPEEIVVVGELPELYIGPSDNAVTPVLGWRPDPSRPLVPEPGEVDRAVAVPLAELADPANRFTARFRDYRGPAFEASGLFVWGFTAAVLDAVLDLASLSEPWDEDRERELPPRIQSAWMRRTI